jgi:tyrosyl-tRNA synthetase
MIQNGGLSVNRNKVSDITLPVNERLLLHEKYMLIQKGKKNYFLIKAK